MDYNVNLWPGMNAFEILVFEVEKGRSVGDPETIAVFVNRS